MHPSARYLSDRTLEELGQMTLARGRLIGYEFDRMVMLFSMVDGQREIPCAISTSAMDDLESLARCQPNQREAQFIRLRDRIEERAARKFLAWSSKEDGGRYPAHDYECADDLL